MRRHVLLSLLSGFALSLAACTLARDNPTPVPIVITATLPVEQRTLVAASLTPLPPPTPTASATATITLSPLPLPSATATAAPPPTATATPAPTRTRPGPTALPPLDDGSGGVVPGTGSNTSPFAPVVTIDMLPDTLYFLSNEGNLLQVWRLQVGLNYPDQLTFSPTGVATYDVAPDGTLAYITPDGMLYVGGIPVTHPADGDTTARATSLAWSPGGTWLAYTLETPGAAEVQSGAHLVDGLWIRANDGTTIRLQPSIPTNNDSRQVFTGPISWRPDETEVLVKVETRTGTAFARVLLADGALVAVWNDTNLPPTAYNQARWNATGTAIIGSGAGAVLRIDPERNTTQILVSPEEGYWPSHAHEFSDGTLAFLNAPPNGPQQLFTHSAVQQSPIPVTGTLTQTGSVEFAWAPQERDVLLAVHQTASDPLGTPFLRDATGQMHNITPLVGPITAPKWGPTFKIGDKARIQIITADAINLRATPGGGVLSGLVNGTRVRITGGPQIQDGFQWWRVQTSDGRTGWVAGAILDDQGGSQRTLLPVE